jgi:hypothetical protein
MRPPWVATQLVRCCTTRSQWFFSRIQEIHGIVASQGLPPLPTQVIDSGQP